MGTRSITEALDSWYWDEINERQRTLCWIASVLGIFLFGIGFLTTFVLLYAHLGRE